MGLLRPEHGLFRMLDLLRAWPEASLSLQAMDPRGSGLLASIRERYGDLLDTGRLNILDAYLRDEDIAPFLSKFDIGLCLYEATGAPPPEFQLRKLTRRKDVQLFRCGIAGTRFEPNRPAAGKSVQRRNPGQKQRSQRSSRFRSRPLYKLYALP